MRVKVLVLGLCIFIPFGLLMLGSAPHYAEIVHSLAQGEVLGENQNQNQSLEGEPPQEPPQEPPVTEEEETSQELLETGEPAESLEEEPAPEIEEQPSPEADEEPLGPDMLPGSPDQEVPWMSEDGYMRLFLNDFDSSSPWQGCISHDAIHGDNTGGDSFSYGMNDFLGWGESLVLTLRPKDLEPCAHTSPCCLKNKFIWPSDSIHGLEANYGEMQVRLLCSDNNQQGGAVGWGFGGYECPLMSIGPRFESYSDESEPSLRGFWATSGSSTSSIVRKSVTGVDLTEWHDYTIRWNKENATFLVDGVVVATIDVVPTSFSFVCVYLENTVYNPANRDQPVAQFTTGDLEGRYEHGCSDLGWGRWIEIDHIYCYGEPQTALLPFTTLPADRITKWYQDNEIPLDDPLDETLIMFPEAWRVITLSANLGMTQWESDMISDYRGAIRALVRWDGGDYEMAKRYLQKIPDLPREAEMRFLLNLEALYDLNEELSLPGSTSRGEIVYKEVAFQQIRELASTALDLLFEGRESEAITLLEGPISDLESSLDLFITARSAIEQADEMGTYREILSGMKGNYLTALREPSRAHDLLQALLDTAQTYFGIEVVPETAFLPILSLILLPALLHKHARHTNSAAV